MPTWDCLETSETVVCVRTVQLYVTVLFLEVQCEQEEVANILCARVTDSTVNISDYVRAS